MEHEKPIAKRISSYTFNFADLLGQGNFSKVYRASRDNCCNLPPIQLKSLPSKSYN